MSGQSATGRGSLSQRVGIAFQEVIASKLKGKAPEFVSQTLNAREDGHHPIRSYVLMDKYSGTQTRVEIAVGRSTSEDGPCYAWIGRNYDSTTRNNVGVDRNKRPQPKDYQEFSSLEEMGDEAVRVFSHHYTVDVMGI
ncbi:MAG: hypothetical protein QGI89_02635 [Candidatus Woesearchaeota archaeon]|nr:hypothetical protein [Candidatus Woesearchaeota archaeon]